jgi:CRP-like cAMP-binding protein
MFVNVLTPSRHVPILSRLAQISVAIFYPSEKTLAATPQSELPITNTLLSALPRSDFRHLACHLELQELTVGQLLSEPGETLRHVYFPVSALLSLLAVVDDSELFTVGLVGREGVSSVASALGSQVSPFRTLVQSSGQAMRMKARVFAQELREGAPLRNLVLQSVLSLTVQIAQTASCNRYHVIEERLARWLLMTRDRLACDHFHMTHEMLGHLMGVRRVGVTNAAFALKERKLIDYNRGAIVIVDALGLEASACSCYTKLESMPGRT